MVVVMGRVEFGGLTGRKSHTTRARFSTRGENLLHRVPCPGDEARAVAGAVRECDSMYTPVRGELRREFRATVEMGGIQMDTAS
jgi:hypothetical protein